MFFDRGVMVEFYCLTRIVEGSAGACLASVGAKRLLMVADPYFRNGTAQGIAEASGAVTEYFFDVEPDPTVTLAAKGAALVKSFKPDVVAALGGGSAMDCAKAMVYLAESKATVVAIPTTSGSGSEVTDFAILTHEGVKHPLVDPALCPKVAILDGTLVEKLPPSLVADGGVDALTHAVEACTATNGNDFTNAMAQEAFCRIFSYLPDSYRGELKARQQVHTAATMAGLAFTRSGLGLCHSMAHALGGLLHLPHGRLNAILLPAVMEVNAPACGHRYASLARRAGLEGRCDTMALRNLKNGLDRLMRNLNLPKTLRDGGIPREEVVASRQKIVQAVLEDPCSRTNPVPVTQALVETVLRKITPYG